MKSIEISKEIARDLILRSQLLDQHIERSTLDVIKKLGYIQIDSISVIERSHHHILWSRNKKYSNEELSELMKSKKIFEYWSHAASYLPIEDYRYCLLKMNQYKNGRKHWFGVDQKMLKYVVDRIKNEGPLASKDFKSPKKTSGWYDWKPAKKALEQLFMDGTLMTKERRSFHKVYDLAENVLPSNISTKRPEDSEFASYLIKRQLNSQGLATISEISYLKGAEVKKYVTTEILRMLEEAQVIKLAVKGLKEEYFCLKSNFNALVKTTHKSNLNILSPFDNLVIQRRRLKNLFDYDYQLECYVPQEKRRFGYFCLPILHGNQFIGSVDLKANRKAQELQVLNFHFNEKNKLPLKKLKSKLDELSIFNNCINVSGITFLR